jgi:hypothetical protein
MRLELSTHELPGALILCTTSAQIVFSDRNSFGLLGIGNMQPGIRP